jgi:hypothetical protein
MNIFWAVVGRLNVGKNMFLTTEMNQNQSHVHQILIFPENVLHP